MARLPTHFLNLDTEPKGAAPPAYRTLTNTASDSWSVNSQQDKRKSWTGLVDSNENLNKYRVNHYPKVHTDQPVMQRHTYFGSACQLGQVSAAPLARPTNSSMSNMSEIVAFSMPKGPYPVRADPIFIPASGGGSYPPSENMAPLPLQPDSRPEVPQPPKRNRLQELRAYCCSPKVTLIFFIVLLFLIIAAIVAIVITQAQATPKTLSMMWQAPAAYRGGQTTASHIDMNGETEGRVRFAMKGAAPFKGNFIAYYDFKSSKAVIVDESLKKNGDQFACFVLPIDTANTPNYEEMLKAAARAKSRIGQPEGWDEEWTMVPSPLDAATAKSQFNPPIPECDKARWIQLQKAAGDQRNQKCTECHDFCLPEFGIQGTATEGYLNIIHRDCFHLFVPEWRSYAQSATPEQNQRDFEAFYRNRQAQNGGADTTGSKWIPLAGMRPPNPPFGPSSPQSIPAPVMPMQQSQQQNNGYGLSMQPYGVNQQQQLQQGMQQSPMPMGQQQPDAVFQPYGVQSGHQQQQQSMQPNAMGTSNGGTYQNGVFGLPQQVANAGQSAVNTIGNAVSDIRQGATNIYNAGAQAVDQFGNTIANAQQSLAGVVNPQTAGTGSSMGGVGGYGQRLLGYGSGGVSNNGGTVDWPGSSQQQQTTYPGGFAPNGNLQSTALEAGIPGVNNPQYYQNGQQMQQQLPNKMGDLTGYAPNVVSTAGGGLQQLGGAASNDPRQMAGVIGMQPSSGPTAPPSSGYVPDVVVPQQPPQQQLQQQQMLLPNNNQFYGRGR